MADEQQVNGAAEANAQPKQAFAIQRVYAKDVSFEAPNVPGIFRKEWQPELNLDVNVKNTKIEDNTYEVVLKLTATNKIGDDVAFLAEVHQAGIFTISDSLEQDQIAQLLAAFCPNILFPYARECLANLVTRASFPQLNLAPVNFDAVYAQHLQQRAKQQAEATKLDA